jgi:hypothetical protein
MKIDSGIHVHFRRWVDNCHPEGANFVPFHYEDFPKYSSESEGIDFGFGILRELDRQSILANPNAIPLNEHAWKGIDVFQPEGYVLVGYPNQLSELTETPVTDTQVLNTFRFSTLCFPVERMDIAQLPQTIDPSFAKDRSGFYGRILPFSDIDEDHAIHIDGMSGGPIFAVKNTDEGIHYRLVAIQAKWWASERVICGHGIHTIVSIAERQLPKMIAVRNEFLD